MNIYEKPKDEYAVNQVRKRIWPGQNIPKQEEDSDDDIFAVPKQKDNNNSTSIKSDQIIEQPREKEDIQTFQQVEQQDYKVEIVDEEAVQRRRRMIQSRVEALPDMDVKEEGDNQQINQNQEKKKKKKKEKKEKRKKQIIEEQLEEEEEEDEQPRIIEMLKPVFVPRNQRDKIDQQIDEELRMKEENQRNLERKKIENKVLIQNQIKSNATIKDDEDSDNNKNNMPSDEDTMDEREFTLWKIRELRRIKKYNEEKCRFESENAEILRRRNLTDQQRIEEDFKLGSDKTKMQEKSKQLFMQKFYHKGAYFQDSDDPIFQRDYNLPVGEDLWDKSKLPQIMQRRRGEFGKRGQTKYTHLTDQDTTDFNPEYQVDSNIRQKFIQKQAGNRGNNIFK